MPYDAARNMIGGGAKRMIELGLIAEQRSATPAELDRLFKDFVEHYSAHIADRSRPFEGLDRALDRLKADGCRFAVCTNKLEGLSRLLLDALGLTARFEAIVGQDTFGMMKPDPEVLRRTDRCKPAATSAAPSWWVIAKPTSAPPRPPAFRWWR